MVYKEAYMALLPILTYPHPTLKKVAVDVDPSELNDDFRQTVRDMIETMIDAPGIGLAAPQVGISKRFLVIDLSSYDEKMKPFCVVNPKFIEKSGKTTFEEGCLSLPGFSENVERAKHVKVEYLDEFGKKHTIEDDDMLSIVLQHENDHLDGIVAADRVSPMKKVMYLKKLKKLIQEQELASV
jgi:peptide deformylase